MVEPRHLLGNLKGNLMSRRESRAADQGLLAVLAQADAAAARSGVLEAAQSGARLWETSGGDRREYVPDLYVSVDLQRATRWRGFATAAGLRIVRPTGWRAVGTTHILVDLDGFSTAPEDSTGLVAAGQRLSALARLQPGLDGSVAVVRTSPGGVQLVFGLSEPQKDGRAWFSGPAGRALCAWADTQSLQAVRDCGFVGGHADQCVHAAGRMMRRPGPRITKTGQPYVSRLVTTVERPGRSL
jgi:hypothetical protein